MTRRSGLWLQGGSKCQVTAAITAGIGATPLLDQDQLTAMMTTNGLPLLDRFGA